MIIATSLLVLICWSAYAIQSLHSIMNRKPDPHPASAAAARVVSCQPREPFVHPETIPGERRLGEDGDPGGRDEPLLILSCWAQAAGALTAKIGFGKRFVG